MDQEGRPMRGGRGITVMKKGEVGIKNKGVEIKQEL